MFQVNGTTITMSRGDTGSVTFRATGYAFGAEDRALFTVKSPEGTIVKQSAYPIDAEGEFTVSFLNAETDYLPPGSYSYDVRYVIAPLYDGEGNIVDGEQVMTPNRPMSLMLLNTVGNI